MKFEGLYIINILLFCFSIRPETKEGKEGEPEKSNEQENDSDKNEKELEKDKVGKKHSLMI